MKLIPLALLLTFAIPSLLSAQEVRIGVLTDLSAGMASWGRQSVLGAEIARDEIEAAGGSIRLFIADHQLQAKNALSEFHTLVDLRKVQAVYSEFTPTTLAIAPLSGAKAIPVIYAAAATSALNSSPYIFKSYIDYIQGCALVAQRWKAQGLNKVAILKASLEFGELCDQGLRTVYPQAEAASYNPGDEVATQVILLKKRGVEAIINASFEPDLLRMLKAVSDLGWRPQMAAQSDAVGTEFPSQYDQQRKLLLLFSLPTLGEEFIAKVRKYDPPNTLVSISAAGLAYLHVHQLYSAVRRCSEPSATCVSDEIAKSPPDPLTGFRGWRARVADFDIQVTPADKLPSAE